MDDIKYNRNNFFFTYRVSALIFDKDKTKILLFYGNDSNYYMLPGGKVHELEKSKDAIKLFKIQITMKKVGNILETRYEMKKINNKVIETSTDKHFVKAINTIREYEDKRRFPIDEIVIADKPVNINPIKQEDIGGLCISTYNKVLRWILRGDTLCDVIIPNGEKVYECTGSKNCPHGVFVANKIILTNPRNIDDELVLDLYEKSDLPWKSYFQILTIIALRGFEKSCNRIIKDKVTKENAEEALSIYCSFLELKENEKTNLYNEVIEKINSNT